MRLKFIKFAIYYALRNMLRHRIRSTLLLFTISFTLSLSTIATRYAEGIIDLWKMGIADTGTAHVQVHKQGYWAKQEGVNTKLTITAGHPLEDQLSHDPMVAEWTRRFRFEGLIATDIKSSYFVGIAVQPDEELLVSPRLFFPGYDQGRFVDPNLRTSAVIGRGLARLLNLRIGDEATLIAKTGRGSVNAVDVIVDGIIDVPLPGFSKRVVYLQLKHAQRLMRLPGRYTELAVRLHAEEYAFAWVKNRKNKVLRQGLELQGWWQIDPFIRKVELIWDTVFGLLCGLMMLTAALTIVNIIFMAVNERVIEIGTLMALGAKRRSVRILFGIEGALLGVIGGVLGTLVGNAVVFLMGWQGIPFESPFGSGPEIVYPTINLIWIGLAFVCTVLVCALCSLPPAGKAASVEPVVAFRGQL